MNMNAREILENITKEHASDIFVVAGRPLTYKVKWKDAYLSGRTHETGYVPRLCHSDL